MRLTHPPVVGTATRVLYLGADGRPTSDVNLTYSAGVLTFGTDAAISRTAAKVLGGSDTAFASTRANTSDPAFACLVTGDTLSRLILAANGDMSWGPGGASAQDTFLTRTGTALLKVDDDLHVDSRLGVGATVQTGVQLRVESTATGNVGILWRGQASQTGDAVLIRDSGSVNLIRMLARTDGTAQTALIMRTHASQSTRSLFQLLADDGSTVKSSMFAPTTSDDSLSWQLGTSVGLKIGTATTQKVGFYNATPIAQRAGAAQAAVATTSATNVAPFGYSTAAQADAIVTLVNELRAWAVAQGFIKGAA